MAKGYKLRLPDGSEIGPMDLQAVKDWYTQGLVSKNDAVLKPGAKTWSKVGEVLELQDLRTGKRAAVAPTPAPVARRRPPPPTDPDDEFDDVPSGRVGAWRTVAAGILFLLGAGAAGYFMRMPERWHPALDGTPWQEIALGQVLLGLFLLRGWDLGRRIVRILVFALGFAVFPLFGILIAQGLRGRPLGAVACVWILASGFFALLSGANLSWLGSALSLLLVFAGYGGIGYLGFVPEKPQERAVREWSAPDRR